MIGRVLGHYQIVQEIGSGGMGVVYKARDMHLDRFVALKTLPSEKTADPERKRRFVQEAKAASALNHPNIVHIYDISADAGVDFIAMEYVEGKTLDERIGRRGLNLRDTLKYAIQITDALAKAHSAGIIHRDLKPSNIMVNDDGTVKILDFGLAKLVEQMPGDEFASTVSVGVEEKPVTEKGAIVGTVAYMSPEQAEGKPLDAAWSPDGKRLAFILRRPGKANAVAISAADGSNISTIMASDADYPFFRAIAWSPDGKRLGYQNPGADGSVELGIVSFDGGASKTPRPVRFRGLNYPFDVSPDGALLATAYGTAISSDIWLLEPKQ